MLQIIWHHTAALDRTDRASITSAVATANNTKRRAEVALNHVWQRLVAIAQGSPGTWLADQHGQCITLHRRCVPCDVPVVSVQTTRSSAA